jgi:hypothetical protein
MFEDKEIWCAIEYSKNCYVSNTGMVIQGANSKYPFGRVVKNRYLNGYQFVSIPPHNMVCYIHHLVWDHFGNRKRNGRILTVDHIDGNKINNNISNLQLLSLRENASKHQKEKGTKSKYMGVYPYKGKRGTTWLAKIYYNGKMRHLGTYPTEKMASLAYQYKLEQINQQT